MIRSFFGKQGFVLLVIVAHASGIYAQPLRDEIDNHNHAEDSSDSASNLPIADQSINQEGLSIMRRPFHLHQSHTLRVSMSHQNLDMAYLEEEKNDMEVVHDVPITPMPILPQSESSEPNRLAGEEDIGCVINKREALTVDKYNYQLLEEAIRAGNHQLVEQSLQFYTIRQGRMNNYIFSIPKSYDMLALALRLKQNNIFFSIFKHYNSDFRQKLLVYEKDGKPFFSLIIAQGNEDVIYNVIDICNKVIRDKVLFMTGSARENPLQVAIGRSWPIFNAVFNYTMKQLNKTYCF